MAIIGFAAPYYFFVSFLMANGPDAQLLLRQLFANNISPFFVVGLIISAMVFWVFLYRRSQRYRLSSWWVYIVATLVIGPSFALPLFLYFREGQIEARASESRSWTLGSAASAPTMGVCWPSNRERA